MVTLNGLMLNPTKSKLMVLGSKQQIENILSQTPFITVAGSNVEHVCEARNLGLRFSNHVVSLASACCAVQDSAPP